MNIQEIVQRINENSRLLAEDHIAEIDRDILLEDIRNLYLIVKGSTTASVKNMVIEQSNEPAIEISHIVTVKEETITPPVIEQQPAVIAKEEVIAPAIEKPQMKEMVVSKEEPKQVSPVKDPEPEWVEEVVAAQEQAKSKPGSLNEVFAGEERSLNQRHSIGDKRALNDHAGGKDLKSMIDFNKQYVLTNELFKGDSQAFQTAISHINNAPNIEAAFEYIKTDLLPKYNWNGDMQSTRLFDKLVRQKFGM
jgi:hypothetical protein